MSEPFSVFKTIIRVLDKNMTQSNSNR